VALSIVHRTEARILTMRPSSRDGLYTLASAWQASTGSNVRPFPRPAAPQAAAPGEPDATPAEPPYWPDGPSAA